MVSTSRNLTEAGVLALAQIDVIGVWLWQGRRPSLTPLLLLDDRGRTIIRSTTIEKLIRDGYLHEVQHPLQPDELTLTDSARAALAKRGDVVGQVREFLLTEQTLASIGMYFPKKGPNSPSNWLKPTGRERRAAAAHTAADDYYVDVLEAADGWFELVVRDEEPTSEDWGDAHAVLAEALEALRGYEAAEGTRLRHEAWGGLRNETFEVIDAADAWYEVALLEPEPPMALQNAVVDRLGAAVKALRKPSRRAR